MAADDGGRRRERSPEEVAHAKDFINRYTTGHPSEGFSSEEAVNYLRQVRSEAPPEVMQRAAVETVRNLPDDQRKAFAEMLQRRQAGSGMVTIERTGQAHAAEGRGGAPAGGGMDDMLGGLFGGLFGGGGMTQPDPYPQPRQSATRAGRVWRGRHARRAAGWSAWRRHDAAAATRTESA